MCIYEKADILFRSSCCFTTCNLVLLIFHKICLAFMWNYGSSFSVASSWYSLWLTFLQNKLFSAVILFTFHILVSTIPLSLAVKLILYMGSLCYLFTISVTEKNKKMHSGFWFENFKERDHLEDLGAVGKVLLKYPHPSTITLWMGAD